MQIVSVDAIPITVPLAKPVVMSHITVERSHNVLVRITTEDGLEGWGEGVEATDLTGETQDSIRAGIEFLAPLLIGKDPLRRTELWWAMAEAIYGNETAIGAIDMALYDLAGKAFGVPVYELIGGKQRDHVPALTMVGSGDPDADVPAAVAKYDAGYRWIKIKLGIGELEDELKTVRGIRNALPPDAVVCGDANQGWTEPQSVRFLRALEGVDVQFIEQPIPQGDHAALIRIARSSPIPVCADQSVHSLNDIMAFGRSGVAGVSLKLVKLGGITGVMRGAALCESLGLSINLAGKIAESSVAASANVHCAAAMRAVDFGCSPANQGVSQDVSSSPLTADAGVFEVPSAPGLGVVPDLVAG